MASENHDSVHISSRRVDFFALGDDIHYLILSRLYEDSPRSLLNILFVSKSCYKMTRPFIYRTIILFSGRPATKEGRAAEVLWDSLIAHGDDNMTRHVRHIRVQMQDPLQSISDIHQVINKINNLRSFCWATNTKMPGDLLSKIQSRWPNIELSVQNTIRHEAVHPEDKVMDTALLSAPQLTACEYAIYTNVPPRGVNAGHTCSEFQTFTNSILRCQRVKRLHLKVIPGGRMPCGTGDALQSAHEPECHGPLQLRLYSGCTMPPLEELTFSSSKDSLFDEYSFSSEHCATWRDCMDWTQLKRLDLETSCPTHLFQELAGFTPSLKFLRCGLSSKPLLPWHYRPADPEPLSRFLQSLRKLVHLEISNSERAGNSLWSGIKNSRNTLEVLNLRCYYLSHAKSILNVEQILELSSEFPRLRQIGIPVPVRLEGSEDYTISQPDPEYISAILKITQLETLNLHLHVPRNCFIFSAASPCNDSIYGTTPNVNPESARRFAIEIFGRAEERVKSCLTTINIHFSIEDRDERESFRCRTFMSVKKLDTHDLNGTVSAKYNISGPGKWNYS
ncbi:hypothetical protein AOQ84DRAFT_171196 [Glonium stellatum]|uniref:Uncharacterized protein n=1 Tax=Glonium stellatum TaxID=574774 RepID=A0A8E2F8A9_9PEZI|nr:hypothetical protein AOQ84DRAFT_171196 [Glonium stellatum]